jgi:hypothetical protein
MAAVSCSGPEGALAVLNQTYLALADTYLP